MNLLDALILASILVASIGGHRMGFVTRLGAWIGGVLGLVFGVQIAPAVLRQIGDQAPEWALVTTLGTVLFVSTVGQWIGIHLGARLRGQLGAESRLRTTDQVLGSIAGMVSVLVTLWFVGPLLGRVPGEIARQARQSLILGAVSNIAPSAPNPLLALQGLIADTPFPDVFEGLIAAPDPGPPPESLALDVEAQERVAMSTVNVEALGCGRVQEGSAFVVGDGLLATNAHVVAGTETIELLRTNGTRVSASVVAFDGDRDLALLRSTDIARDPLPISEPVVGIDVAIFGHPDGQDQLRIAAGRTSDRIEALGRDITGRRRVSRDVLVMAAELRPGDSGSAVVDPQGNVVGVTFAVAADRNDVAYALSSDELRAVLDGPRSDAPVSTGPCLS